MSEDLVPNKNIAATLPRDLKGFVFADLEPIFDEVDAKPYESGWIMEISNTSRWLADFMQRLTGTEVHVLDENHKVIGRVRLTTFKGSMPLYDEKAKYIHIVRRMSTRHFWKD